MEKYKNIKAMYVEDEAELRSIFEKFFFRRFDEYVLAENGKDGVEKYQIHKPDIIVTDVNMPVMDGFEMIKAIKESTDNPPQFIITTAFDEQDYLHRAIDLSISRYVLKPIQRDQLVEAIEYCAEVANLKAENRAYREDLEKRVEEETRKRLEQEKLLIDLSKNATIGEMLSMITHQWKQPLNTISLLKSSLVDSFEYDSLDEAFIQKFDKQIQAQIEFMNKTVDTFKNFLNPHAETPCFDIRKSLNETKELIEKILTKNNITLNDGLQESLPLAKGNQNEFTQIFLNLINNSKDAMNENSIKEACIDITAANDTGTITLVYQDNCGGMTEEALGKSFETRFTTKGEKGSGMGLYMCKLITKKHGGTISVKNSGEGVAFTVTLKVCG